MKQGIYHDLSNEDYHNNTTHLSSSRIKPAFKSITHFFAKQDQERKRHFEIGNAFELLLLEPKKFVNEVAVFYKSNRPEPNKTFAAKANEEWKAAFFEQYKDFIIITEEDFKTIKKMVKKVKETTNFDKLLSSGEVLVQPSMFWTCPVTKVKLKTRQDIVILKGDKKAIIIDVKSCRDGSERAFLSDSLKFDYPVQASIQIEGAEQVLGVEVSHYFYLAVETEGPNNATIYSPYDLHGDTDYPFQNKILSSIHEKLFEIKKAKKDIRLRNGGYGIKGDKNKVVKLEVPDWYFAKLSK